MNNSLSGGRKPLGREPFCFGCHEGVACFKKCCRALEMYLYPYDLVRLKERLGIHSRELLEQYAMIGEGSHPYFPAIRLRMNNDEEHTCPFLDNRGCSIYSDRPSACRTYPLERGVERDPEKGCLSEHYFLTHHSYCQGHKEDSKITVKQWLRTQQLHDYNLMNDLWAELDALFASNPWQGEGAAGPRQQLAFMVCYNLDDFRAYLNQHNLLRQFRLSREDSRRIEQGDTELLKFGFEWLKHVLTGTSSLLPR